MVAIRVANLADIKAISAVCWLPVGKPPTGGLGRPGEQPLGRLFRFGIEGQYCFFYGDGGPAGDHWGG